VQEFLNPFDQFEIGAARRRIERDELLEDFQSGGGHREAYRAKFIFA
jgi:hypothetical protein